LTYISAEKSKTVKNCQNSQFRPRVPVGFFKNWYSGQFVYFICKKHTQKTGTLSRVPGGDGVRLLRHTSLPGYDTDVTQHYTDPHSDPIL